MEAKCRNLGASVTMETSMDDERILKVIRESGILDKLAMEIYHKLSAEMTGKPGFKNQPILIRLKERQDAIEFLNKNYTKSINLGDTIKLATIVKDMGEVLKSRKLRVVLEEQGFVISKKRDGLYVHGLEIKKAATEGL